MLTRHWQDGLLEDLVHRKLISGQRVSLVVPARNEAATVGGMVGRVREALVDTIKLLDEIVVFDSDSTDDTYAITTEAGAVVHRGADIRPKLRSRPGKGEAMWKSLFVIRGDLIVFIDADLKRWDIQLGYFATTRPGAGATPITQSQVTGAMRGCVGR